MASMAITPITAETVLDDLMTTYKETIPIFIRRKMMCIGCQVARIHDVREACYEHGIPIGEFLDEVNAVVRRKG